MPHKVFFNSWIVDAVALEMIGWAQRNFTEGSYHHHPRAHTWHFKTKMQLNEFLSHRPMMKGRTKSLIPTRSDDLVQLYPWPPDQVVSITTTQMQRKVDPIYFDFAKDLVEDWCKEQCRGRVTQSSHFGEPCNGHMETHYVDYEFEFPEDAVLFKVRWG
ncbi:MAG: hypothetical protein EOP83_15670 [Verrucomicrobiaceae bacterium]|nr:MAG: hypothetical protein EOP83_15670 [Verrucomicrobiaceae bacterium]